MWDTMLELSWKEWEDLDNHKIIYYKGGNDNLSQVWVGWFMMSARQICDLISLQMQ